jgi:hypothetical protein
MEYIIRTSKNPEAIALAKENLRRRAALSQFWQNPLKNSEQYRKTEASDEQGKLEQETRTAEGCGDQGVGGVSNPDEQKPGSGSAGQGPSAEAGSDNTPGETHPKSSGRL